jgi:hypothetical protein
MVASLRANSGGPRSIIPNIVTSIDIMNDSAVSNISSETMSVLVESGVNRDVQKVQTALVQSVETLHSPLDFSVH